MSLQTTMMDATTTLMRPTSVSRDSAQGVVQNFEVIDSALICSEQQAGGGDKLLYAQRNVDITTTIYFIEDPGATVNDMLIVTSDWTQMTKTYLAVGNSKSDTHGLLWYVNCVEVVAPATAPVVTLPTSASVTDTTAILGGTITSDGGSDLTEVGVWSARPRPTPTRCWMERGWTASPSRCRPRDSSPRRSPD